MNSVLQLRHISKTYGVGHTVVHAVNDVFLEVKSGEIVLIMGPSGSGKTTLLSMAGLLLQPSEGAILIEDQDTTSLKQSERAALRLRTLGFVFQSYNLLGSLTARENVELVMNMAGKKGKVARERSLDLLAKLGMRDRADHLPAELSGGEKQRVAIARAIANNPVLILADEPTGNLDSKTGHDVMELLCCGIGRDQGRAIVIVTHDHRLRAIADRVLWLEDGQLSDVVEPPEISVPAHVPAFG